MVAPRELTLSQTRIRRASDNIREFAQLLDEYLDRAPSRLQVTIDEYGNGALRVERLEPIPETLSILLGEALQNLRAGLDNCLYAAAIIDSGANPPPGASALQWPIVLLAKDWEANKRRIRHLSPRLLDALEQIQPFHAEAPGWNCLLLLHDLARIDRHRAPHELAMWPSKLTGTYDTEIIHNLKVIDGPIGNDGTVVTFTKSGEDELTPAMLDLRVELDIDVRDVEMVPHMVTGKLVRPWGTLDKRMKTVCAVVGNYTDGLIGIAQRPD